MSVAPDDPMHLPDHRRPPSLGGNGKDPVFRYEVALKPHSLFISLDSETHALVEPQARTTFDEYQRAIHSTQQKWMLSHT